MAVLIDFSQTCVSNIMASPDIGDLKNLDEGLIRHMILQTILSYKKKLARDYGELIICSDGKGSWRKDFFKQYKGNRKKVKESSKVDWETLYKVINEMKIDLVEYFNYPVLELDRIEADDIIYFFTKEYEGPHVIVSGDKDFIQLLSDEVDIYSLTKKSKIKFNSDGFTKEDVRQKTLEHLLKGDSTDGIPNVISPDDIFQQDGVRQKPMTKKRIEEFNQALETGDISNYEHKDNYLRNRKMILLDESVYPDYVTDSIYKLFDELDENPPEERKRDRGKIKEYMIKYKLRNLLPEIGSF